MDRKHLGSDPRAGPKTRRRPGRWGRRERSALDWTATSYSSIPAGRDARFVRRVSGAGTPSIALIPAAPVFVRNNDVEHEYRQDSDFFYLSGFDEPESALVLDSGDRKTTRSVRPRTSD